MNKANMLILRRWALGVGMCGLLIAQGLAWGEDARTPEAVVRAIWQLGDSDFSVRERATKFLWSAGKTAESALVVAAKSADPEISSRAKAILGDFKYGLYPQTPKEVATIIRRFRLGELDRSHVIRPLVQLGRPG